MAKFVIAYASLFDNTIKIHQLEGESDIEVLQDFLRTEEFDFDDDYDTIEKLEDVAFNGDSLVTIQEIK